MRLRAVIIFLLALAMWSRGYAQDSQPSSTLKFAWGAAFDGELDMSGHEQSSVGMDGYFGLRAPGVQILGVGVGVNVPVSNSQRRMPIYLIARSNFSTKPTLCFMDLRCGISANDVGYGKWQTGEYASVGAGFNLARSKAFSSHLILSYTFYGRKNYEHGIDEETIEVKTPSLQMVTLRFGISF